jgi:hypothetical protein
VQKKVRVLVHQRLRDFRAGLNPARKASLYAGTALLVTVLFLDVTPDKSRQQTDFTCRNPELGHTVAIVSDDSDTPNELARKYCKGNLSAAADAFADATRYTTDTIFHGAIIRLPNSE